MSKQKTLTMQALVGRSVMWGTIITLNVLFALWLRNGLLSSHLGKTLLVYFLASLIAFPIAVLCARFISNTKRFETRFASHLLLLSVFTIGLCAAIYALDYWHFYSQWHAPTFSIVWIYQFFFTNLGALYQFASSGLHLFLPFGPLLLLIFAYQEAR